MVGHDDPRADRPPAVRFQAIALRRDQRGESRRQPASPAVPGPSVPQWRTSEPFPPRPLGPDSTLGVAIVFGMSASGSPPAPAPFWRRLSLDWLLVFAPVAIALRYVPAWHHETA